MMDESYQEYQDNKRLSIDLRSLAAERVTNTKERRKSLNNGQLDRNGKPIKYGIDDYLSPTNLQYAKSRSKSPSRRYSIEIEGLNSELSQNNTPEAARILGKDFLLNSHRARANSDEFVGPRWIPDDEIFACMSCHNKFDWFNRKHHCRNCGQIYCEECSKYQCLLPIEYGERDPQRVCLKCSIKLESIQISLTNNIANHHRTNNIDIISGSCILRRYTNLPYSNTLGSELRKAAYTVSNIFQTSLINDSSIPLNLLANAKGLAFLTVIKGGFIFAPRFGTGLIISKLSNNTWSAPSAIGVCGVSYGLLVGADLTDYMFILNTDEAVIAFSGIGQISIGAGIDVAVGALGRSSSAVFNISDKALAPAISYSHSRGLYAGVSLEGSILMTRTSVNHNFYGRILTPVDILSSKIPPPRAANCLYNAIDQALSKSTPIYNYDRDSH